MSNKSVAGAAPFFVKAKKLLLEKQRFYLRKISYLGFHFLTAYTLFFWWQLTSVAARPPPQLPLYGWLGSPTSPLDTLLSMLLIPLAPPPPLFRYGCELGNYFFWFCLYYSWYDHANFSTRYVLSQRKKKRQLENYKCSTLFNQLQPVNLCCHDDLSVAK